MRYRPMASINENYIWPLFGIGIFSVLIAFYVDDRRKLLAEGTDPVQASETNSTSTNAETTAAKNNNHTNSKKSVGKNNYARPAANTKRSGSSAITNLEFTGSIEEYLAKYGDNKATASTAQNPSSSVKKEQQQVLNDHKQKRNTELQAFAEQHSAFSGSMQDYLASFSHTTKEDKTNTASKSSTGYAAKPQSTHKHKATQSKPHRHHHKHKKHRHKKHRHKKHRHHKHGYSGSLDGYLSKYKNGNSAPGKGKNKTVSSDKLHKEHEHHGFHGSYEEYSRLYNQ